MLPPSHQIPEDVPRLFGIRRTNRPHDKMWGKNCFNSAFPTALACYMWENGMKPVHVYVKTGAGDIKIKNAEIGVDRVFNAPKGVSCSDLHFAFETGFQPYVGYSKEPNELDGADLVVRHGDKWLRPLQVKLTAVPDVTSSKKMDSEWGPELVLRPADSSSCTLGIYHSVVQHSAAVKKIFEDPCAAVRDWDNTNEVGNIKQKLFDCVANFLSEFHAHQQPYLLHQIWKTKGFSHILAENAFDIFVWTDFALITAFLNKARREGSEIQRAARAVIRFARALHELADVGKIPVRRIYREMNFGKQTDKDMAMSGAETKDYMLSSRRTSPSLPPSVLSQIILNDGHKQLSPERRLDQALFFTADKYFKDESI